MYECKTKKTNIASSEGDYNDKKYFLKHTYQNDMISKLYKSFQQCKNRNHI